MTFLDAGRVRYRAVVNGLDVTHNMLECSWEHTSREVAERAIVAVALHPTEDEKSLEAVGPGAALEIHADGALRFSGRVEEATFTEKRPVVLECVAYATPSFDLGANEDDVDFGENHTPHDVKNWLAGPPWRVAFGRVDWPAAPLARQPYRQKTLAYVLEDVNQKLRMLGHGDFYVRCLGGVVDVVAAGSNDRIWHFGADNTEVMTDRQSTKDLVTRVKVIGTLFAEGGVPSSGPARPFDNPDAPPGRYGIRQRLINQTDARTHAEQQALADATFAALGSVVRVQVVEAPDVPEIRKGDAVQLSVGTASGRMTVTGVHHNGRTGRVQLEFDSTGRQRRRVVAEPPRLTFPELPPDTPLVPAAPAGAAP